MCDLNGATGSSAFLVKGQSIDFYGRRWRGSDLFSSIDTSAFLKPSGKRRTI